MLSPRAFSRPLSAFWFCLPFGLSVTAWAQNSEVPGTVPRGQWLLESDLVSSTHDRLESGGTFFATRSIFLGNVLLSTGLGERLDVQAGFDGWLQDDPGAGQPIRHGHGDGVVRMKWNFLGKDGETLALALLPQLRIPISSHGLGARSCEPGVLLPWTQPLGSQWIWGGMLGVDSSSTEQDSWSFSWVGTTYLSRSFGERLGAYCEWVSSAPLSTPRVTTLQLGLGLTYTLSKPLALELCLYRALNSQAPDWNPVLRMSYSF